MTGRYTGRDPRYEILSTVCMGGNIVGIDHSACTGKIRWRDDEIMRCVCACHTDYGDQSAKLAQLSEQLD